MDKISEIIAGDKILVIEKPSAASIQAANNYYNQTFRNALENSAMLRITLDKYLEKQGIWSSEKQKQAEKYRKIMADGNLKLQSGGIKLSEAYQIAIDMRKTREKLNDLSSERIRLDSLTAEGQAETARLNCLIAMSLVYKDSRKPYYDTVEDYITRADEEIASKAAMLFITTMNDFNENIISTYPENRFLKEYNFVNDKYQLINKQGKLIDEDGRLVDEHGRYIDNNGNFIDINGNRVDKDGVYEVEFKPFLDDDGKEIVSK